MNNIWKKITSLFGDDPLLSYQSLLAMSSWKWESFADDDSIMVRVLPNGVSGLVVLECKMKAGAVLERHMHDYNEIFLIMSGHLKDNVSNVVMKPDGKVHKYRAGTAHEPYAINDVRLLVFCESVNK